MAYPKKRIAAVALLGVLCLAGCGHPAAEPENPAGDPTAAEPAQMITPLYGAENQTGTATGYYEWGTAPTGDSLISYLDYATQKKVYLCSQPNCKHGDESCSAWRKGPAGMLMAAADGTEIYGIQTLFQDEGNLQELWKMEPGGAGVQVLATLDSAEIFCDAAAQKGDELYLTVRRYDGSKRLLAINTETGKQQTLLQYGESDWIYGAFDDQLVILYYARTTDDSGTFTFTTYSLQTQQTKTICEYSYADSSGETGTLGRTEGNFLYLIEGTGNTLAKVTKMDMRSGDRTDLCGSLPFYQVDTTSVLGVQDGRMIISIMDPDNPEAGFRSFALNCETGELREIAQRVKYSWFTMAVPVVATLAEKLLVVPEYRTVPLTLYGKDGLPYQSETELPVYALIGKKDFWAGQENYQPVEDVTLNG